MLNSAVTGGGAHSPKKNNQDARDYSTYEFPMSRKPQNEPRRGAGPSQLRFNLKSSLTRNLHRTSFDFYAGSAFPSSRLPVNLADSSPSVFHAAGQNICSEQKDPNRLRAEAARPR